MSDFFELYKAAAIGGPLGIASQRGWLEIDRDDSGFERGLKTAGQTWLDFNSRVTKGIAKSIEGIVDFGLGIAAGVTDLFGADSASRELERRIQYNWTDENFKKFDAMNSDSLLRGNKVGEFIGDVAEGVGGMVPSIAMNAVLPGSGMITMGVGAAGNATEEALNDGAGIGSALGYGAISGGIEALTEKIGGFTFDGGSSLIGKATAGTGLGKFLSKGAGKLVGDFVSDGAEEVLSDTLNPLAKKATGVDTRSLKEQYGEVVPGLGKTFLVGGTVGSVMSGGQSFMRNNANKSRGGARASRADDYLSYITEVSSNLKGADTDARYDEAINNAFLETERELAQMSENARKTYLKSIEKTPFRMAFDENGKYIGVKADSINPEAVTNNLRSLTGNLNYAPVKADTELNTDALEGKRVIEDIFGKDNASVVISDSMNEDTRATVDIRTGVIYINNNMEFDESFSSTVAAIHEIVHTTEGTAEYHELIDTVKEAIVISDVHKMLEGKDFSVADGEELTDAKRKYIVSTELNADLVGHLLSTPGALARLRARNKNIFNRLKAFIESAHDNSTSKEGKKALNKVLKSFDKALDASHGGVLLTDLRDDEEKENTEQKPGVGDERKSFTNSKTGIANDALLKYDEELYKLIKNNGDFIVYSYEELVNFVNLAFGNPTHKATAYFGIIKPDILENIEKNITNLPNKYSQGLFVKNKGYSIAMSMDDVRHMVDEKSLSKNDVIDYLNRFADLIIDFDSVAFDFYVKGQNNTPGLLFKKRFNDGTFMSFSLVSKKKKSILLHSLYMDSAEYQKKKSAKTLLMQNAPAYTPEVQVSQTSNNSILENSGNVNSNERNSKKSENRGVNWNDLTEGTDIGKQAEDNDYIRVHPPVPNKKTTKEESSKAEPEKEMKKPKRPLKVTKALTDDEAHNIIAYIMEDHFKGITEDTKTAYLPGTVRKDVQNRLTHIANTNDTEAYVGKVYEIAELICNEAIIREQYDISDRADVDEARRAVDILDSYKGKINLEAIREDIKSKYDTRAPHLIRVWGMKKTRGVSTDVIKEELAEYGIKIDSINEADIFTDMIAKYDQAKGIIEDAEKSIATKVKDLFKDDADGKALLIENVANDLHTLFNKNMEREYFKTYSKVLSVCRKFDDIKKGTYVNATENEDAALKNVYDNIKTLRGGLLSVKSVKETFAYLSAWYSDKNKSLEGRIDSETQGLIKEIAFRPDGPINVVELKNILKVLQRVQATLENYTKVYRDGKYQDIGEIVEKNIETAENAKKNDNTITKFYRNKFFSSIADPQYVCELLDGYRQGFAMATLKELREGEIKYSKAKIDILKEFEAFIRSKENRDYIDNLSKRSIDIDGKSVPMDIAISAYMTNKRCHAQKGLQMNGFEYKDKKGNVTKIEGYDIHTISDLGIKFTEQDKRFISIVEGVYLKCKDYKYDTDMIRLGFSNIVKDYYYPIFRVHATSIESSEMYFAADSVNTVYFNKNTVQGAKQRLVVKSVLDTMVNHIEGIARYTGYAICVDNFNKLWNFNTVENKNNPVTIKNKLDALWGKGSQYIVDLVNDVQGKRLEQQPGAKIINWIRGSYATYQLGANPKVWFTQLSSYLAAFNKLSSNSMLKAFTISGEDVDKYCTLAEIRNNDMQVAKAQSVTDKIGKIGNLMMKPISVVDRMVVRKLFAACQVEISKREGLALGSEENKVRAGALLTDLIFETQQNSFASERSAVMRRSGEIVKSFTMFSADAMKLWSRWFGAIGKHHTIRRELYLAKEKGMDTTELNDLIKNAKIEVAKTTTSVVTVAAFMAVVAMAFRHLYNKDDEEKDAVTFAKDFGANIIGMFPFIRDAYSYFSDGYEIGTFATDTFNTVLGSLNTTYMNIGDAIEGKYVSKQTFWKNVKEVAYGAGQVLGIPTRNIYNFSNGMINRFFEGSLGYRLNNLFYGSSYSSDLGKAIEEGDETKVNTILSLASRGEYSSEASQVISKLYGEGYNCLPKTISEKLTVAGVEYELTGKQYRSIKDEYGKANGVINDMVGSSDFTSLSAESQSKAIKFANDYYFAVATEKGLNMSYNSDSSYYKKLVYGKLIDVKVLAMAVAKVNDLKSTAQDGDDVRQKIRDYIQSLSLSAEQKYLLFNYFGYTSEVDKERIVSYIKSSAKLSTENKEYLLKRYK